jgi:hypothetical protein
VIKPATLSALVLMVFAQLSQASGLSFTVQSAWQGVARIGYPSELAVRLLAETETTGTVSLESANTTVSANVNLAAGEPQWVYLPAPYPGSGGTSVAFESGGSIVLRQQVEVTRLEAATTLLAVIGAAATHLAPPVTAAFDRTLYPETSALPRFPSSYRALSSLVITAEDIAQLTPRQTQALQGYLGACGELIVAAGNSQQLAELKAVAGCGGKRVKPLGMEQHRPSAPPPRPAAAELRNLAQGSLTNALPSVLLFFAGYVLVLLLVWWRVRSPMLLLTVPLASAALAMLGWTNTAPAWHLTSVAQMDSGDTVARYTGIIQVAGMSRAQTMLPLDSRWGVPESTTPVQLGLTPSVHLAEKTRLISHRELLVHGVVRAPGIEVSLIGNQVTITNLDTTPLAGAMLAWQGEPYPVPDLIPGQRWLLTGKPHRWEQAAPQNLLRQKSVSGGLWLLLDYPLPDLRSPIEQSAWLLVRGGSDA